MPIYLTEKFADKIDERFSTGALSTPGVNTEYDWVGAKTIKITSVSTAPLTDYKRDGNERFGKAKELENQLQEMTLTQDKAFTFSIDKMNEEETKMKAGEALARQLREVVIPHIDTYRFAKMVENAGTVVEGNLDAKTVYNAVITATEALDEAEAPENRVLFATPEVIKHLKESDGYVKASELAQSKIVYKGQVAELDGMPVVKVISKRLGANFIVCHKSATVAPIKLSEYRIHLDPVGISGSLAEGRFYFDAFVLTNKKDAIYVHKKKESSGGGDTKTPTKPKS